MSAKKDVARMLLLVALLGVPFFPAAGAAGESVEAASFENLTPEEAAAWLRENGSRGDVVLLDVRTPQEFRGERIPGAVLIDYLSATFREELGRMDRGKRYLVYCRTGSRSDKAVSALDSSSTVTARF